MQSYKEAVYELFQRHQVDSGHGYDHAITVMTHAEEALKVCPVTLTPEQHEAVLLAALLHDVDDRKFFPSRGGNSAFPNAEAILGDHPQRELIIRMISLVSFSKNGNSIPEDLTPEEASWMLIPRWADRREATGPVGVLRCIEYSKSVKRPMSLPSTPIAHDFDEAARLASPERLAQYLKTGASESAIDHMYDKIIHLCISTGNSYIDQKMKEDDDYTKQYIIDYFRLPPESKDELGYPLETSENS
jgi:uncharacterized protein